MFAKGELPIIGILRGISNKDIFPLAGIFIRSGIKYIEITMNTAGVESLIPKMILAGDDNLVVGAGTVLSLDDLSVALSAGAKFIVCPSLQDDIVSECVEKEIPVFPGILTPTELHKAMDLGVSMVKLFPAGAFGPEYIKALKGPFDKAKIVAVGGVSEKTIGSYINNGADGVAFGAGILKPNWLAQKKYDLIEESLCQLIGSYHDSIST